MRKTPMRMCVGCRQMKPKKELIRVVKTSDGAVNIDPTGKKEGRGAYICPDRTCFTQARKQRQLDRALGYRVEDDFYELLSEKLERVDG